MNKYINHIWDVKFSFEHFLDLIISDPNGLHVYDAGLEFEIGQWYRDITAGQWCNELFDTDDIISQKLKKIFTMYDGDPDMKKRVRAIWGHHSMVDPVNSPLRGSMAYDIFGINYHTPEIFLLKVLCRPSDNHWDPGLTPHETLVRKNLKYPTVEESFDIKPTMLFNCPMNRTHPHRINAFHALIETGLFHKGYVAFANIAQEWETFVNFVMENGWLEGAREYFQPILTRMDTCYKKTGAQGENPSYNKYGYHEFENGFPDMDSQTRASFTSVFDIITETTCNQVNFFTEKTFKSVFWGRPFVVLGSANQNQVFADMGYQAYTDFFDLELVDPVFVGGSPTMHDNRAVIDYYKKVLEPLTHLEPKDYAEIKSRALPTIKHNHDVMVKHIFSNDIIAWDVLDYPEDLTNHFTSHTVENLRRCLKQHSYFGKYCP